MIQYFEKFHEKEKFVLTSSNKYFLHNLRTVLKKFSFEEMGDFFFLDRKTDNSWQSVNLTDIEVYDDDRKLGLHKEESWNKLIFDYMFATLPFESTSKFLDIIFTIASEFNLIVAHRDNVCSREDLERMFNKYRDDVQNTLQGEPGSEIVRINILMSYPRK